MMTFDNIFIALLLTLSAGMATAIGALMAFFTKKGNNHHLSGALGLSAGVMVYVSFMELVPDAVESMEGIVADPKLAMLYVLLSFFGGMALIALIDWLVPEDENPHEVHHSRGTPPDGSRLKRTGIMLALTIGIHNFPEGVATFVSGLEGADIALPIVVAVAIHNIPEGIAVSVPILQATVARPSGIARCRGSPSRSAHCSHCFSLCLYGLLQSIRYALQLWPASWCI